MRGSTPAPCASQRARFAAASLAALTAAALGLSGCSNFGGRGNSYTCPAATIVPELQTLVQLVPGPNGAAIQSSGRLNTVTATCDREGDTGLVTKVTTEFAALRTTPAINRVVLPYFVALADANGTILGKQQFNLALSFEADAQVTKAADDVTVHIPLKNAQLGNVYTLLVGFQLTQSQLDYNRAHMQ